MRFTHFQVTFQQAAIYIPPVSLRGRRANAHLLVMFNAWTSQRLPVGHNCKHLKSTSVRHLIALFEITTRSHHWATAQTREWGSRSNMASDSVRSGRTNYEDSTPEWASDTFAYRSPNKNPFLRFTYPRVKKECTWIDLTKCPLHKRYKFQLAYSILFAYFIALWVGPPRPLYSGWFGLCRGSGTKSNTKFQKPEKQILKKFKIKRKIQVSSFIRCAFVFFSLRQLSF